MVVTQQESTPQEEQGFMTVSEASRKLGVNVETVYRLLYSGRLKAVKREGVWNIDPESVVQRMKRKGAWPQR
jgi:excisionase family DNA binding protein